MALSGLHIFWLFWRKIVEEIKNRARDSYICSRVDDRGPVFKIIPWPIYVLNNYIENSQASLLLSKKEKILSENHVVPNKGFSPCVGDHGDQHTELRCALFKFFAEKGARR